MRRSPGRPRASSSGTAPPRPPSVFRVGRHEVTVWEEGERWVAAVNGRRLASWYTAQVDAWTAGVTESDRLDREGGA